MMPSRHQIAGLFLLAAALLAAAPSAAAPVVVEIRGVDGEMRGNVRARLSLVRAEALEEISVWRLRQMSLDARGEVERALRPFGYYQPRVDIRLIEPDSEGAPWRARIDIEPGDPIRVREAQIELRGPGADEPFFRDWLAAWPIPEGERLHHPSYTAAWQSLERIAEVHGYFHSRFEQRRITVDPGRGTAEIVLVFDTGPRYRFGEFDFGDTGFSDSLMERLTVVEPGAPYQVGEVDRQRDVLVRSQYFRRVVVEEKHDHDEDRVDLAYRLDPRPPNTYRVLAGFGTDTGPRIQFGWTRHYLGSRGNRLESRVGAQRQDNELVAQSEYQHPFGKMPGDFLTLGGLVRRERERFRFQDEDRVEEVFESFSGRREQLQITTGRLRERELWPQRFSPLRERLFISFLNERFDAFREATFGDEQIALLEQNPAIRQFLDTDTNTVAVGAEWTLFSLRGRNFATEGEHFQVRVLGSHEAMASDVSFLQGYASARWHWLIHPRHKLLLRGELGWTAAETTTLTVGLEGDPRELRLNITELPELYRFKTGGDRTVRGYGFETLSTNRNGANNLMVGSVEYEYNLVGDWSLAAFYDIGNAFNDDTEPKLKAGTGIGVRWYTLIGPVRLDIARPLDDRDTEFRIHFTIGTQLL